MTFSKSVSAAALLVFAAASLVTPAVAQTDFPTAVAQVLQAQQDGPVGRLPAEKKEQLIACVNGVLTELPNGKKRYVIEAVSFDELEDRFGKVVMENRAEWKQRIARSCSHIVV